MIGMALAIGALVTFLSVSLIADDAATHGVCEFSVVGRALLEGVEDHSSIRVEAWLGGSSANTVATCQVDGNGDYTLGPIPCLEEADSGYAIVGIHDGYATDSQWLRKPNGTSPAQVDLPDLVLHIQKQVSFDWVYQPNGTTTFDSGLQQGTTTVLSSVEGDSDHCGFIFATETVTRPTADVYFGDGKRYPYGFWANNGIGGVIDMGPIALESVTEAPETGYRDQRTPVMVGHTYCVYTKDGSSYAKLHVTSMGEAALLIAGVVTFPDPGLEAAIREATGKPTGDIHDTDVIGLM